MNYLNSSNSPPRPDPEVSHSVNGSVSITAVISYHNLSILKWYEFIILQFGNSEVQSQFHLDKVKVSEGSIPSGDSRGESVPCHCHFLETSYMPWFMIPSTTASSKTFLSSKIFSPILTSLSDCNPSYKNPCEQIEPIWIIQATLPISTSLTQSHLQSPFCLLSKYIHRFLWLRREHPFSWKLSVDLKVSIRFLITPT